MLATLLLGWSYLSYYSYSCRSLGRDRGCAERVATAAAAAATATVAQQMTRVPGTGWVSGYPACELGAEARNLWARCNLLCHTHTHTHTHTHITPGPHTNPDITHTRVPCTWGYRSLMHRMLHVAPAGRCLTHSPSQQSTHPHHPRASHKPRYHTHTSLPADDSRRQPCTHMASSRHAPRYVMCR